MARIEQVIEVDVPVSVAYHQLTQYEEYPSFMEGVHSVRQLDDAHLHWHARRNGKEMEWESEITHQIPDRSIAWRNSSGPKNEGEVTLHAIEPDKTRITLVMDADDELIRHHDAGGNGLLQPDQDLVRFKQMLESRQQAGGARRGEIRESRRVDGGEAASSPAGGGVAERSGDQINQVVRMEEKQLRTPQQSWAVHPLLPGVFRAWEAQFSLLHRMGEQMERMLDLWLARAGARAGQAGLGQALGRGNQWTPPVEVSEQDNRLIISADLPGIRKKDVQVAIVDDCLTIEGERREETQRQNTAWRHSECSYGHFYRAIPLPAGIDADAVSAAMHDGVLEITVPLHSTARAAHRLEVQQAPH